MLAKAYQARLVFPTVAGQYRARMQRIRQALQASSGLSLSSSERDIACGVVEDHMLAVRSGDEMVRVNFED